MVFFENSDRAFTDTCFYGKPEAMMKVSSFFDTTEDWGKGIIQDHYHEKYFSKYIETLNLNILMQPDFSRYKIYRPNDENTTGIFGPN